MGVMGGGIAERELCGTGLEAHRTVWKKPRHLQGNLYQDVVGDGTHWRDHASNVDYRIACDYRGKLKNPKSWEEYDKQCTALVRKYELFIRAVARRLLAQETMDGREVENECARVVRAQHFNKTVTMEVKFKGKQSERWLRNVLRSAYRRAVKKIEAAGAGKIRFQVAEVEAENVIAVVRSSNVGTAYRLDESKRRAPPKAGMRRSSRRRSLPRLDHSFVSPMIATVPSARQGRCRQRQSRLVGHAVCRWQHRGPRRP